MMNSVNIIMIKLIVNFILPEKKSAKQSYSIFVVIICNQKDHMNEETHEFLEFTETINNIIFTVRMEITHKYISDVLID